MMGAAGFGGPLATADEALKAAADYITDTNDADGVAKAMEKFCFQQN